MALFLPLLSLVCFVSLPQNCVSNGLQHWSAVWGWAYHGESVIAVNVVGTGGKLLVGKAADGGAELVLLLGQAGNVDVVGGEGAGGDGADAGLALM